MSFDPQNAPDRWVKVLGTYIDVEGVEFQVVQNQDGEIYTQDVEETL